MLDRCEGALELCDTSSLYKQFLVMCSDLEHMPEL